MTPLRGAFLSAFCAKYINLFMRLIANMGKIKFIGKKYFTIG
jgi:hypothetical protein